MFNEEDAKKAIINLAAIKGLERARLIEMMMRWETAHFKSKQYKLTGSPGMELGDWSNLDESKFKTIDMPDNHPDKVTKLMRTFLIWPSVFECCMYLSDYIDRHDGNYARWNTTNVRKQAEYRKAIQSVKARFI